ncbi:MAG: DUF3054 domain-containing protein [Thermoleophilia bacterium]
MTGPRRELLLAALADVVAVLVFVAMGRTSHHESLTGLPGTAAPFLLGLVVAWAVVRPSRAPRAISTGLALGPLTAGVGVALRVSAFHDSAATAFIVVAFVTLTVLIAGWRSAMRLVAGARRA